MSLRKWLEERETLLPRKKLVDLINPVRTFSAAKAKENAEALAKIYDFCDICGKETPHVETGKEKVGGAAMTPETFLKWATGEIPKPKTVWKEIKCTICGSTSWVSKIV